jgi:hypothetical protein
MFNMFRTKSPMKTLLTLAILGNVVVGVPVTPAENEKGGDTDESEQVFYSVQCEADTWGVASHCQAWCNGELLNFNHN